LPCFLSGSKKSEASNQTSSLEDVIVNKWKRFFLALFLGIIFTPFWSLSMTAEARPQIKKEDFGKTAAQEPVEIYTLTNRRGAEVKIMTYGGIITSVKVPDRNGKMGDVVLGYDNLESYLKSNPFFGALVGRYGNRIAKGKFSLNGKEYTLARNNGLNHLHGGIKGFDKVVWKAKEMNGKNGPGLSLSYLSKDGEEGYPGNLSVTVVYTWTDTNELKVAYTATTDKETVVNLTQHSYFNLAGSGDILKHEIMIAADKFTPVDATLIPTGELRSVKGTPMDFTKPVAIGARIDQQDEQLKFGRGYDHNYVLNGNKGASALAARVYEATTGRLMEVYTTEPGIQFYTGNFLDGMTGKGGQVYGQRHGFCLETQHFPDSPNQPKFPSTTLKPGQKYMTTTSYRFSVK
jgi:aldose 1-epimerase